MGDLISRQAAIDGLSKLKPRMIDTYEKDGDCFLKVRACDVNDMLEGLPSAQPEQRWIPCSSGNLPLLDEMSPADVRPNVKGEWIDPTAEGCFSYDAKAYSECSECGKKEFLGRRKNFCPNCGADNRGGGE